MGWFDEQIQQKIEDQENDLNDVLMEMAGIVMNDSFHVHFTGSRAVVRNATNELLTYFHKGEVEVPESITEPDQVLEYLCSVAGLMKRPVTLEHGWYRNLMGAMLGTLKEDGTMIAILPGRFGRYHYYNPKTRKKIRINRRTEKQIDREAICFYNGLPEGRLSKKDIRVFMRENIFLSDVAAVVAAILLSMIVGLFFAPLTRILYGAVLPSGNITVMLSLLIFILTLKLFQSAMDVLKDLNNKKIVTKLQIPLQAAGIMRILNLPTSFFRNYSAGDLASRVELIPQLCEIVCNNGVIIVTLAVCGVAYCIQISAYSLSLVKPVIYQIVAVLIFSYAIFRLRSRNRRKVLNCQAKETGKVYAILSAINKIRLTGSEKVMFSHWAEEYSKVVTSQYEIPFPLKISHSLPVIISLITLLFLYFNAAKVQLDSEIWFAFIAIYGMITGVLQSMTDSIDKMAAVGPLYDMLKPFFEIDSENSGRRKQISHLQGSIEVNNVTFSYTPESPNVLEHLSLNIRKGEYVAIVGKTGCGKSTLLRLLLGFEKPKSGQIYFDGISLTNLDLQSLRQNIGVVTQDGKLFLGDIYSNIVICKPTLTVEDAWKAAEIAGIADDIRRMPMGMNTLISEDNGGVSGGQRQRLMIARAVAHRPPILFFDEATSALDNISQKIVSDSLAEMNCTRLVIAHRLSTIRACDRILVMDGGRVVANGNYETLVETSPIFAELVERQSL